MIRNDNVAIGSIVAVGTDEEIVAEARGRGGVVRNITWPAKEGRGRRNYIAAVAMPDGTELEVPVRYLSAIPFEAGLVALLAAAAESYATLELFREQLAAMMVDPVPVEDLALMQAAIDEAQTQDEPEPVAPVVETPEAPVQEPAASSKKTRKR